MTFGVQSSLAITVCKDAAEAIDKGLSYHRPTYLPIEIVKAVVVQNGTQSGNPSVDLILVDEKGQHYAMMITGRLLKMLTGTMP
jgi:hypothetical protein